MIGERRRKCLLTTFLFSDVSSQMDLGELDNVAVAMLILIIEVDVPYVFVIRIHSISLACVRH